MDDGGKNLNEERARLSTSLAEVANQRHQPGVFDTSQPMTHNGVESIYMQYGLSDAPQDPPANSSPAPWLSNMDGSDPAHQGTTEPRPTSRSDTFPDRLPNRTTAQRHRHKRTASVVSFSPTLAETYNPFLDEANRGPNHRPSWPPESPSLEEKVDKSLSQIYPGLGSRQSSNSSSYLPRLPFQRTSALRHNQKRASDLSFASVSQLTLVPSSLDHTAANEKPGFYAVTFGAQDKGDLFLAPYHAKALPATPVTPTPKRILRRTGVCAGLCCFALLFVAASAGVLYMMLMVNSNMGTWSHRVEVLSYGMGNPHQRVQWDREREEWEARVAVVEGLKGLPGGG